MIPNHVACASFDAHPARRNPSLPCPSTPNFPSPPSRAPYLTPQCPLLPIALPLCNFASQASLTSGLFYHVSRPARKPARLVSVWEISFPHLHLLLPTMLTHLAQIAAWGCCLPCSCNVQYIMLHGVKNRRKKQSNLFSNEELCFNVRLPLHLSMRLGVLTSSYMQFPSPHGDSTPFASLLLPSPLPSPSARGKLSRLSRAWRAAWRSPLPRA